MQVPPNTRIEYKYIRKTKSGQVSQCFCSNEVRALKFASQIVWESDPNRKFVTQASGPQTVDDVWR